ncbi:MAG: glycosyltransferase family 4 protein [Planctomycetes bacterium]|nr:glycosyltransferase family 4 protein [Planctomycetota bacterium]
MHICHIITRLIIGGAQENTVLTCRGLVQHGHKVTLIAGPETGPEGSLWNEAEAAGCELITLDSMRRAVNPLRDWRARNELTTLLRKAKPDVVHTHSSKAGILGRSAAAHAGISVIVHTIHGMSFNRTQSYLVRSAYRMWELRAARHTTGFVSVADAMTDQAVAAGLAPRDRFTTIRSGMETDRYRPDPELRARVRKETSKPRRAGVEIPARRDRNVADDDVVVGTIARLFVNKGYEEIIAAMPDIVSHCPNVRFVWIGDGANRAEYENRLTSLGLRDRVYLTGLLSPNEVAEQITGFDILLHASKWEGLPRAVVQGLLTEVPAVSFDNDGAPEVVISDEQASSQKSQKSEVRSQKSPAGGTGILVPYGDIDALATAVVTLARDAGTRQRMGSRGRERCLSMFDWRTMVEQLDALYNRLFTRGST